MNRIRTTDNGQRTAGFTLVELLVVIAIIMMLASILVPAFNHAMKKADIAKARSEMATIVSAINAYANEYGVMPAGIYNGYPDHVFVGQWGLDNVPGNLTLDVNGMKGNYIFRILRGLDSTNNPKKMVFLEIPEAAMQGECVLPGHAYGYKMDEGYFLDPWNNPYMVIMDTSFDGQIGGFADTVGSGMGNITSFIKNISPPFGSFPGVRAGVMCYGPNPGDTNSFMMSWQ